jgi:FAD/FMN-containing dehydrogenase
MDVVVPLGSLPAMVADIDAIRREHRVRIATAFHAGDGNLHPGIMHDDRDPDETRRAEAAAGAILRAALARRGSITGEHGVGLEKRHALPWQLDAESGRLLRAIKGVFDPAGLLNPGKLLPPAESVWAEPPPEPAAIAVDPASLIVSAPAAATVAAVQQAALAHGLWLPVGLWLERSDGPPGLGRAGTVGELVEQGVVGPGLVGARDPRECLLEVWAETGDGRRFHAGAPVAKNVAGYDLTHLLCGTAGLLGRIRAATFQLRPVPERLLVKQYAPAVGSPVAWDALHPVLAELTAGQNSDLAAPLLIAEGDARGVTGPVVVIVAGRDRAWDLGRREERLDEIASGIGPCARRRELAFTAAAELLARGKPGSVAGSVAAGRGSSTAAAEGERPGDIVPDWALTGSDWTLLQPTAAAPGGGVRLPEGLGSRLIWQAWPRAIWTPHGDLPTPAGWVPDPLWRAGRLQPPPSPPPSVPLALLARLQQLFDPDGNLARPDWLADAADSAAALAGPGGAA